MKETRVMHRPNNRAFRVQLVLELVLLAVLLSCAACSKVTEHDDGQGFRLVQYHAREVIPNLFAVGENSESLRMHAGWRWQTLADGQMGVKSLDGGIFVVIETDKGLEWRIYRAGNPHAAQLQIGNCGGDVIRTHDRRGLQCVLIFGKQRYDLEYQNRFRRQDGPSHVMVTRFDLDGHIVDFRQADVPVPIPGGWCDGGGFNGNSTPDDELVVVVTCNNPNPAPNRDPHARNDLNFRYVVLQDSVRPIPLDEPLETDENRDNEFDKHNW